MKSSMLLDFIATKDNIERSRELTCSLLEADIPNKVKARIQIHLSKIELSYNNTEESIVLLFQALKLLEKEETEDIFYIASISLIKQLIHIKQNNIAYKVLPGILQKIDTLVSPFWAYRIISLMASFDKEGCSIMFKKIISLKKHKEMLKEVALSIMRSKLLSSKGLYHRLDENIETFKESPVTSLIETVLNNLILIAKGKYLNVNYKSPKSPEIPEIEKQLISLLETKYIKGFINESIKDNSVSKKIKGYKSGVSDLLSQREELIGLTKGTNPISSFNRNLENVFLLSHFHILVSMSYIIKDQPEKAKMHILKTLQVSNKETGSSVHKTIAAILSSYIYPEKRNDILKYIRDSSICVQ